MHRKQYSSKERKLILDLHNNCCDNCGNTKNLEIAHIVPLAVGGTEKKSNIAVLCQECHNKQHANLNYIKLGKRKGGRPIHKMPDNWREIVIDYLHCKISRSETKTLLNISQKSHLQEFKWFNKVLEEENIVEYSNKVDYVNNYTKNKEKAQLGYVRYSDNTCVYYYNNGKEVVKK